MSDAAAAAKIEEDPDELVNYEDEVESGDEAANDATAGADDAGDESKEQKKCVLLPNVFIAPSCEPRVVSAPEMWAAAVLRPRVVRRCGAALPNLCSRTPLLRGHPSVVESNSDSFRAGSLPHSLRQTLAADRLACFSTATTGATMWAFTAQASVTSC